LYINLVTSTTLKVCSICEWKKNFILKSKMSRMNFFGAWFVVQILHLQRKLHCAIWWIYWQQWWIETLVWEGEHFTIRSIPLTLNIQSGVANDVVEAWYSNCWWVGIIKSFHVHDKTYFMNFLESIKNHWIFMHSTFLPLKIGWNLEMFIPFLENAHGINFKFIKVFNKVSLL